MPLSHATAPGDEKKYLKQQADVNPHQHRLQDKASSHNYYIDATLVRMSIKLINIGAVLKINSQNTNVVHKTTFVFRNYVSLLEKVTVVTADSEHHQRQKLYFEMMAVFT